MKLPFLSLIACVSSTQIACDEKNKCHPKADCYQEKNKQESVQIEIDQVFSVPQHINSGKCRDVCLFRLKRFPLSNYAHLWLLSLRNFYSMAFLL